MVSDRNYLENNQWGRTRLNDYKVISLNDYSESSMSIESDPNTAYLRGHYLYISSR